jgi:hypothetical protein
VTGLEVVAEMASGQYILRPLIYPVGKNSRRGTCDIALKITYLSLQMFDLGLTLLAAHLGFPELNPFVRASLASPGQLAIFKFGIPLIISWFVPGKFLIPAIVLLCGVVGWNVKELVILLF